MHLRCQHLDRRFRGLAEWQWITGKSVPGHPEDDTRCVLFAQDALTPASSRYMLAVSATCRGRFLALVRRAELEGGSNVPVSSNRFRLALGLSSGARAYAPSALARSTLAVV